MYGKIFFGSIEAFTTKASFVLLTLLLCCLDLRVFGGIFKSLVEIFIFPKDSYYFYQKLFIFFGFYINPFNALKQH